MAVQRGGGKQTSRVGSRAITHAAAFIARPRGVPLAVEVRNKWWMNDHLAGCLRRHGVVWVLPEQATSTVVRPMVLWASCNSVANPG
jgi:hypothetical protein